MKILRTAKSLKVWRASVSSRKTLGFVPTMGCLHEGHFSLVKKSQRECSETLVSVFVNPTQFRAGEDFERYPRSEKEDLHALKSLKVGAVFLPRSSQELYPLREGFRVTVPAHWDSIMEGRQRPGHFQGVANVVLRLLLLARADRAYFGEKDIQQLRVVEDLVRDFQLSTRIRAVATQRDQKGLALSSRNIYLNEVQQEEAAQLYRILREAESPAQARQRLLEKGFEVEYVEAWDDRLHEERVKRPYRLCAAVRYKGVRLIDNTLVK